MQRQLMRKSKDQSGGRKEVKQDVEIRQKDTNQEGELRKLKRRGRRKVEEIDEVDEVEGGQANPRLSGQYVTRCCMRQVKSAPADLGILMIVVGVVQVIKISGVALSGRTRVRHKLIVVVCRHIGLGDRRHVWRPLNLARHWWCAVMLPWERSEAGWQYIA